MSVTIAETRDIATCRALRRVVFIKEQGVSEADEVDDLDDLALHLLASDAGRPVGTARLLTYGSTGKIGRVCVLAECRGTGLGAALIRAGLETFRARGGIETVKLGAQAYAQGFYEKLGFTPIGGIYEDAGIPHIDMVTRL